MTLLEFKLLASLIIFLAAFLVGLLPTSLSEKYKQSISITEAMASGIFLGAALFHMLPDAESGFRELGIHKFPYAITLCVLVFMVLATIEQAAKYFSNMHASTLTAWLLLAVLSIHSIIEGSALGINKTLESAVFIFVAIIAHKSSASFALVVALNKNFNKRSTVISLLLIFSIMTPLGILLATEITTLIASRKALLLQAIFNSLTAGTFLYIGTLDTLGRQLKPQRLISRLWESCSLLVGMTIMNVVAAWI